MRGMICGGTALLVVILGGCAHVPLARNTGRQVQTIASIQEQQVLDNIAMFVANPGATPFFAQPTGGATQVKQGGSAGVNLTWNPTTLVSEALNINGNTSLSENWSLQPVNNPDRLKLMKCVYQYVTRRAHDDPCMNCRSKLEEFFGDDYLLCETPACWFGYGTKKQVPSCCKKVGHYCGMYVWVKPENFDQLSRVTLAILDIATVDPSGFGRPQVEIEETLTLSEGWTIKGKYSVSEEKYEKWRKEDASQVGPQSLKRAPELTPEPVPELFRPRIEPGTDIESLLLLPQGE